MEEVFEMINWNKLSFIQWMKVIDANSTLERWFKEEYTMMITVKRVGLIKKYIKGDPELIVKLINIKVNA